MRIFYYDSLNDFSNVSVHREVVGDIVKTLGFYNADDGGAATYIVVSDDGMLTENLIVSKEYVRHKNHELRILSENGNGNVEQFGAKGIVNESELSDEEKMQISQLNKSAIESALNSGIPNIEFSPKKYLVSGGIIVERSVNVLGNSATVELTTENTSVIAFYDSKGTINNASISDINIKGIFNNLGSSCTLLTAKNIIGFSVNNVRFIQGDNALSIYTVDTENEPCSDIYISNCIAENIVNGFGFRTTTDVKIKNCRMILENSGVGISISDNSHTFSIEDLSVSGGEVGVNVSEGVWSEKANERIFFKNLQVTDTVVAVNIYEIDTPIHFANAMIVDVYIGVLMNLAENITMTNSSVILVPPATTCEDIVPEVVPIYVFDYAKAMFTHTQFEFPRNFQRIDFETDEQVINNLVFVDCTLQKTDIAGVEGVVSPCGFGSFGAIGINNIAVNETFDACEFRSCIKDYKLTTGEGENTVITYNFPITLSTATNSGSKLIIKNCRFINEDNSDDEQDETQGETQDETQPPKEYIPYFRLDDNAKFDNIVVYNCFFENYNYKPSEDSSVYPLFGKLTNNGLSCDVDDHNIFARCNMRSSAPDRTNGTTINEVLEYN